MNNIARRLLAVAVVVALCCGMCSCSRGGSDAGPSESDDASVSSDVSASPSSSSSGKRLAASLSAYITYVYNREKSRGDMSEAQEAMVARAAEAGSVSAADYEAAWNNFKQCLVDRGYTTPVLRHFPNGLYQLAGESGGPRASAHTEEEYDKLSDDLQDCTVKEVLTINTLYQVQVGNPNLLDDPDDGVVDCLHKAGVVPESYTKQQLLAEEKTHSDIANGDFSAGYSYDFSAGYSYDRKDPTVRGCFAAFNSVYLDGNDPNELIWYPFPDSQPTVSATQ